jgi:hypothetical protein
MRFILAILLICGNLAQAKEPEKTIIKMDLYCFKSEVLIADLKNNHGEEPIVMGKSALEEGITTMVFVNQTTGSYTVVGMGHGIGCVFDTGNKVKYRFPKALESKLM